MADLTQPPAPPGEAAPSKTRRTAAIIRLFKQRITWIVTGIMAAVAALVPAIANIDTLYGRFSTLMRDRAYFATLARPYPEVLKPDQIELWKTGRLRLALYQIDGYLGQLKASPKWLKLCLTSQFTFPQTHASQFNERLDLPENYIDRENKRMIRARIDEIEIKKTEDAEFQRTNDPFLKLLNRASIQLLYIHKDSEIDRLDKSELYLLRNAIFARHGYPFETAKLQKYSQRKGWATAPATFKPDLSAVERCNAWYLEELHAARELGALGRGILIRTSGALQSTQFLKAALCTCLAHPKVNVECRDSTADVRDEFRDAVDLVLTLEDGEDNRIEWTFLDPGAVLPTDLEIFRAHENRFIAAAVDFNAGLSAALANRKPLTTSYADQRGPFWGAKFTLAKETREALEKEAGFLRETSARLCTGVKDALENAGPFIPRMFDPRPLPSDPRQPELKIVQKPIPFDDVRIRLTKDYVKKYYGASIAEIEFEPRMIVLHSTGTTDPQSAYDAIRSPLLPGRQVKPGEVGPDDLNFSFHYLIDRDGVIYNLMKDFHIGRHIAGLDRHAIGIGVVGSESESFTDAQVQSTARLARFLSDKYRTIGWMVGEHEYSTFMKSELWEQKESRVQIFQTGPGPGFLRRVRTRLGDAVDGTALIARLQGEDKRINPCASAERPPAHRRGSIATKARRAAAACARR